jgi:hypothetical protein
MIPMAIAKVCIRRGFSAARMKRISGSSSGDTRGNSAPPKDGKTSRASRQSRQPSRHTSVSGVILPSAIHTRITSGAAGPYCPPAGGRTYQATSGSDRGSTRGFSVNKGGGSGLFVSTTSEAGAVSEGPRSDASSGTGMARNSPGGSGGFCVGVGSRKSVRFSKGVAGAESVLAGEKGAVWSGI